MEAPSPQAHALALCLRRYRDNMGALYALDAELAGRIDALPFAAVPTLQPTRDGHWTVQLVADDGRPAWAHSRYEPVTEAQRLVAAQCAPTRVAAESEPAEAADSEDLEGMSFLLAGVGLGYAITELENRFNKPFLMVAEDDLGLLKAALCVSDLTEPLRGRRITFLTAADKAHIHERLRPVLTLLMLGIRFITPPLARRYHAEFQTQITALLRDFAAYGRIQMVSVVRNARITCQNAAFNIRAYLANPGVEVLARRAAGYPAIVVSAGPSLARNLDQLGPLRERAVIIGVQTVLRTLLERGVPPHFVTSLDYHEISGQFFHGIREFGGAILVAEPKVTWRVPDAFRGPIHMLHSPFIDDLLREAAPPRAALRAGSTVAHLAFYLAEHLGCDPVILVGQDLAFTEGLYYPAGMQVERIWQPELSRFVTVEMRQWERIVRCRGVLRKIQDIHGRPTYTDEQMFTYAEQFQSDFLRTQTRVIHATEGGMRLEGTEVLTLREAAERFCTRPLPPELFRLEPGGACGEELERARAALDARVAELRDVRAIAQETHELLARLVELIDRPAEFNRLVARVDELRTRLRKNERTYNMVCQVSQRAELRRVQADRAIHDDAEETPASARRRLKRDREFVAGFIDGCDFLIDMLPQARERLSH